MVLSIYLLGHFEEVISYKQSKGDVNSAVILFFFHFAYISIVDIASTPLDVNVKLRKEMGNVSKRQQPDHRADNSRRPPCSEKLPYP